ncbi:electron transfer flavoprotein subunit beta/FixA family protein [Ruicaihuangia caeni]|uniref:Electron transfer flavoprotein subunit beta n=1 Tax=Ruicaihuangia caeni TaxID=3042517 RepID=A0AAW6TCD6_9MICO|nr:electron transfer flavoprotein subunit beta/FixA family protein [Klugiella sp. YN-L-19]MDI2098702.1 electron transfer flavoprotein subunit beta/FixA family protein [Klugiella sp. YN-L-19]
MKIITLVKQVPDTWSERRLDPETGRVDRAVSEAVIDEISERAIEAALALKDADKSTTVTLLTMGPAGALDALRKGLSMGADDAVHIRDDALQGADVTITSRVIAAALLRRPWDLVIAGNESTDGRGGVLPAMLAERLGVASATGLDSFELTGGAAGGDLVGRRSADGVDEVLRLGFPSVVSITERMPDARFPNFRGILGAKKKPVEVLTAADLGLTDLHPAVSVVSVAERPPRQAGTRIIDDGSAAAALADFFASRRLI